MLIECYNIKYAKKPEPVVKDDDLLGWLYHTEDSEPIVVEDHNVYLEEGLSAPKELKLDLMLPLDWLLDLQGAENYIKRELEKVVKFKVQDFDFKVKEDMRYHG